MPPLVLVLVKVVGRSQMCCFVEIAMLVVGIVTLVRGEFFLTKQLAVRGAPAYVVGAILTAVFPLALITGFSLGFVLGATGQLTDRDLERVHPIFNMIDIGLVAVALIAVVIIVAFNFNKPPKGPRGPSTSYFGPSQWPRH